jgi:hypothetical protein
VALCPRANTNYSSSLTAKTVMQQGLKQTCSRDAPATGVQQNPEYKSIPQDLTDKKVRENLGIKSGESR